MTDYYVTYQETNPSSRLNATDEEGFNTIEEGLSVYLLDLPGPSVVVDLLKPSQRPWAGEPPPPHYATDREDHEVAVPSSNARLVDSEYIQAKVTEDQYSSLVLKLVGFGNGTVRRNPF
jgi:hypothetical protein